MGQRRLCTIRRSDPTRHDDTHLENKVIITNGNDYGSDVEFVIVMTAGAVAFCLIAAIIEYFTEE